MLKTIHLRKEYKADGFVTEVVSDVNLHLKSGRIYVLVGESGVGKSTLAAMLMGLLPPTSGQVLFEGVDLASMGRKEARRRFCNMQMVLQDGASAIDPCFTVYKTIAEPIRNLRPMPKAEEDAKVHSLLQQVGLSADLLHHRAHELSGGQQKRVCIARALALSPKLLLFDEAVSGLDVIIRKNILELLKQLQTQLQFTCLFITHDAEVAYFMADEILLMRSGKITVQA